MSKRAGEFITLDELLAEVGVDAARWFFASRGTPRRHRLRHRAGQEAVDREPRLLRPVRARPDRLDPAQGRRRRACPRRPTSRACSPASPRRCSSRGVARFPEVVEDAVAAQETQGITAYATELATQFHAFYRDARVVDPERAGAVGEAARAGARGEDDARERARRCSGSRRPSRCSARRGGRAARPISRPGRGRSRAGPWRRRELA